MVWFYVFFNFNLAINFVCFCVLVLYFLFFISVADWNSHTAGNLIVIAIIH